MTTLLSPSLISIIISTYNHPDALELALLALAEQRFSNYSKSKVEFEVIVADDGSTADTVALLAKLQPSLPYQLQHVWHEDAGFRLALIRNKAVAKARGDYLIFMDGDCIPRSSFVCNHTKLAEPSWFVAGNRILLSKDFATKVLAVKLLVHRWSNFDWLKAALLRKECNRFLPMLTIPLSFNRPLSYLRKMRTKKWRDARGCNLAMWKQDFLAVKGFDDSYEGWGYEDSDIIIRLLLHGVRRKDGNCAVPVIHLWHAEATRERENLNYTKLMESTDRK